MATDYAAIAQGGARQQITVQPAMDFYSNIALAAGDLLKSVTQDLTYGWKADENRKTMTTAGQQERLTIDAMFDAKIRLANATSVNERLLIQTEIDGYEDKLKAMAKYKEATAGTTLIMYVFIVIAILAIVLIFI